MAQNRNTLLRNRRLYNHRTALKCSQKRAFSPTHKTKFMMSKLLDFVHRFVFTCNTTFRTLHLFPFLGKRTAKPLGPVSGNWCVGFNLQAYVEIILSPGRRKKQRTPKHCYQSTNLRVLLHAVKPRKTIICILQGLLERITSSWTLFLLRVINEL